jgi:hypothetical protein
MGNGDSIPHSVPHSVRTVLTLFLASMAALKVPAQDTLYVHSTLHVYIINHYTNLGLGIILFCNFQYIRLNKILRVH